MNGLYKIDYKKYEDVKQHLDTWINTCISYRPYYVSKKTNNYNGYYMFLDKNKEIIKTLSGIECDFYLHKDEKEYPYLKYILKNPKKRTIKLTMI